MGVPLRLAVTAATVYGLVLASAATQDWPLNADVVEWNDWINALFLPAGLRAALASHSRVLVTYTRNVLAGTLMYHSVAGAWALYIYQLRRRHFFPDESKVRRAWSFRSAAVLCWHLAARELSHTPQRARLALLWRRHRQTCPQSRFTLMLRECVTTSSRCCDAVAQSWRLLNVWGLPLPWSDPDSSDDLGPHRDRTDGVV